MSEAVVLLDPEGWRDASTIERESLRPPPRLPADQWCEQFLWLAGASVTKPGLFSFGAGRGYMREWLASASDPLCRLMVNQTSTQVGKTTAQMAAILWAAKCDPSSLLFIAPRDIDVKYMTTRRLRPIIEETPVLRALLTGRPRDFKQSEIELANGALVYTGTGRSPASVKSKPVQRVLLDEVNAFPLIVSKDEGASAIMLAGERTRDWAGRELVWLASTPTTEGGAITQALLDTDQREYWIPCPHCGWWQALRFGQLHIPKTATRQNVGDVHYPCEQCTAPITDREKRDAVDLGRWVQKHATIDQRTGAITGATITARRGWRLPALYAPKLTWVDIASKWLWVQEDPENRTQHWTNSWLAEPYKDRTVTIDETSVKGAAGGYKRAAPPAGALVLTAGVDAQKAGFHFVVRAWGLDGRSWLVDEGYVSSWDLLLRQTYYRTFEVTDPMGKRRASVVKIACDSRGGREAEVYAAARQYGPRFIAIKGLETMHIPYRESELRRSVVKTAIGQRIVWVNTNHYKRRIFSEMARKLWLVFDDVPDEYVAAVASEELVRVKTPTGFRERYEKRRHDLRNDKLDCEVYAMLAADVIDVGSLVSEGLAPDADPQTAPAPEPVKPEHKAAAIDSMFPSDRRRQRDDDDWVSGGRRR